MQRYKLICTQATDGVKKMLLLDTVQLHLGCFHLLDERLVAGEHLDIAQDAAAATSVGYQGGVCPRKQGEGLFEKPVSKGCNTVGKRYLHHDCQLMMQM